MIDEIKSWIETKLNDNGLSRVQTTDDEEFGRSFLRPPSALYAVKIGPMGRQSGDGKELRLDVRVLIVVVGRGQNDATEHFINVYDDLVADYVTFSSAKWTMEGAFVPISPQEPEIVTSSRIEYGLAQELTATVIYRKDAQ